MQNATQPVRDRYPGAQPFADTDLDRRLFFGRELEIEELSYQIIGAQLLVLFGKSGLGKTSLLQAGVFPWLRQQDLLPLLIRLNQPGRPVLEDFLTDIDERCRAQGIDYTPGERGSLWEFFKTTAFWRVPALQTPVLVLDQFEEVFTLRSPEGCRRVAEELGQLLHSGLPTTVRARRERGEQLPYSDTPPAVKVVLSLREDYLGYLEELAAELPHVLETRFRLLPLNREAARRAIVMPAALEQGCELATPAYRYSDAAVDEILDFLANKSRGEFEPFQVQVMCQHVEKRIAGTKARGSTEMVIDQGYLGGAREMKRILRGYYRTQIRHIQGYRQRRKSMRLCEDGLLNEQGRRLSLEEKQIQRQYGVKQRTLNQLVDVRLLRKEPRLESFYYEISHDRLAEPILKSRPWRMPRWLRLTVVALVSVFILGIIILSVVGTALLREKQALAAAEELSKYVFWAFGDELEKRGHTDLLETLSQLTIDNYESIGTVGATADGLYTRGAAYSARARQSVNRSDLDGALSDYKTALGFLNEAADRMPKDPIYFSGLSGGYYGIGYVNQRRGKLLAARDAFEEARSAAEQATTMAPNDPTHRKDLADAYDGLGFMWSSLGKSEEALQAFEAERRLAESTQTETDNEIEGARWKDEVLVSTQQRLAELYWMRGQHPEALRTLADSQAAAERLISNDDRNLQWLALRLSIQLYTGNLFTERGDLDRAEREYLAGKEIARRLIDADSKSGLYRTNLLVADKGLALTNLVRGDFQRSRDLSVSNRDALKQLADEFPTEVLYKDNLADCQRWRGYVLMFGVGQYAALRSHTAATGREAAGVTGEASAVEGTHVPAELGLTKFIVEARDAYEAARQILEERTSQSPGDATVKEGLAWAYEGLGYVGMAEDRAEDARSRYEAAREIIERLTVLDPANKNWLHSLAAVDVDVGRALLIGGRPEEASEAFQRALTAQEQLAVLDPSHAAWQESLAASRDGLGDVLVAQGELEGALAEYEKARLIRERLTLMAPGQVGWELDYIVSLYKLAVTKKSAIKAYLSEVRDRLQKLDSKGRLSPIAQQWSRIMFAHIGS